MVSTRRGGRADSEVETVDKDCSDVPATPSTGRKTRSSAKQTESPTRLPSVESSSHLDKDVIRSSTPPPSSLVKRCTRASRLHSPEHPCTPLSSIHDADVSDSESCCSVLSDLQTFATKTRSRRVSSAVAQKDKVNPEVESCSPVASKTEQIPRRSTRKKPASEEVEPAETKTGIKNDEVDDSSDYRRVTRSQRKSVRARSKEQTDDSDVESCISSVSGADVPPSASRRKRQLPPLNLDEASEQSRSPAPRSRPTRTTRRKVTNTSDLSEPFSADSDGFESGPSNSSITRRGRKSRSNAIDSDSDLTDRGTPCSSRTNSGNIRNIRVVVKNLHVENACEPLVEQSSFNDSRLENTVIAEEADVTLVEEDTSQISEERKAEMEVELTVNEAEEEKGNKKEDDSEAAIMTTGQQEEPVPECRDDSTSELVKMQQIIETSEALGPAQPDVETHEEAPEKTEEEGETMEVVEGNEDSQEDQAVSADVEKIEKVEDVSDTVSADAQQVVEICEEPVESTQVTSQQQQDVTEASGSGQEPHDSAGQSKNIISLLDSSDDDDDDDDDDFADELIEDSKDELQGDVTSRNEAAASSVDGLFMIDTRPGQEADEDYYKERPSEVKRDAKQRDAEQGDQEDEFVDEEDDDEDDDEDAGILFSSRNKQLDTLSSRIDPGIRLKELGGLYINFGDSKSKSVSSSLQKVKEKKIQDEVMGKSVIGPDFQKKEAVPPYKESKYALKRQGKAEREKTTGDAWFNMKAPELTQELKGDLRVLKMRASLDPKRFYKKNDRDGFPKYFQVGTVVDSPADFYHSHISKKQRKRTMVEELLADAEFRQSNKKKYQQIMTEKAAQLAGKKNRKKNKFNKKSN